jgi:hypothetical protein
MVFLLVSLTFSGGTFFARVINPLVPTLKKSAKILAAPIDGLDDL